jgi:hypothetical protein
MQKLRSYFDPSKINVGASPADVDRPAVVPQESQLEQL